MHYYRVMVASPRYQKEVPLVYSSESELSSGAIVSVTLQGEKVRGIVVDSTAEPSFKTQIILETLVSTALGKQSLELANWMLSYYPAPSGSIYTQFLAGGRRQKDLSDPLTLLSGKTEKLPVLTASQRSALKKLKQSPKALLHGDTGSGKTRVYIELAKSHIKNGSSVLVLTPEIGLTPQLVKNFKKAFDKQVMVTHSRLSDKERSGIWNRVHESSEPFIVIGTRSALFLPFHKLGLVVVDESHDSSYKHEQSPRYDGRRVAAKLANLHGAHIVYGSATPSVSDYYTASAKNIPIVRMSGKAVSKVSKLDVVVVSARDRDVFRQHAYISDQLINAIKNKISSKEQSLIFLNRRGTARIVLCSACGWQAACPRCDLPLTYHGDSHTFICHTCGYQQNALNQCPTCGNTDIAYKGIGTKALIDSLSRLFPEATIQRFDTDNKKADRLESHYDNIVKGKVDILVGTQLLTKGLDLPHLGLVGVISADTSLAFPDYTAEERTYQMLTQIIGRVGRGHRNGTVIIQTHHPESPVLHAAVEDRWETFYQKELKERRQYMFPPFCHIMKLTCSRKTANGAMRAAVTCAAHLRQLKLAIEVVGPSPSFYTKKSDSFNWQIIVKAKNRSQLTEAAKNLPNGWTYDLDPTNLL